jgi:PAS domain S-box-containing protein
MAEGVVIVDADCKPTYANATAQRIMGMSETQFQERSFNDEKWLNQRVDGSVLYKDEHPMYTVLRTGQAIYDFEISVSLSSGTRIFISVNTAPLTDDQGKVIGGIATFTDVTSRRMVLQQKDDFISVASHELKTPITALKASIQLLERLKENIRPELMIKLLINRTETLINLRTGKQFTG